MASIIKMPKSSLTMQEGTILKWYKREGEEIEKGEPLTQIMEEKSTIDLESPSSGVVKKIYYEEQMDVPVGRVIAVIGSPDEELPELEEGAPASIVEVKPPIKEKVLISTDEVKAETIKTEIRASPLAKRIAREKSVDLNLITGTGPGGRIIEEDVRRFMEEKEIPVKVEKKVKERIPLSGMRKIISERMVQSSKTYPRITLFMDVDFTDMKNFRERLKTFENIQISYTDIIVKAVAKSLSQHPIINSSIDGEEILVYEDINIGVAVATELGLTVPVIHGADNKTLTQISGEVKNIIDKARRNMLTKEELSGGTFTITNLGMFGIDFFTPLINPPECAILGIGRITEKTTVTQGRVEPRLTSTLTLSFDHRIIDGVPASKFLQTLKKIMEGVELD